MSQYFDMGDETLWNPSNGAAQLFVGQVGLYEDVLGVPSGIGPMESDECQVDPVVYEAFVGALLTWRDRTQHRVIDALSAGFIATALALGERARIRVDWPEPRMGHEGRTDIEVPAFPQHDWAGTAREQARELDRSMAR
ncbi:DUF6086 family protein [Streptomyces sp. SID12501]|uniref:Uncharacterized protein n=1 Tax=Streptomyces sp. SID12501 TaxID=2706042 RepID=A0A6B3BIX4_9ACTN|nr:DUF6086 family protein [Streptomyces sp. SID12501]NEC85188.1 hypothetical protein [Streptomyces sp. SID12501]